MAGVAIVRLPKAMQVRDHRPHASVSLSMCAMHTPSRHDNTGISRQAPQVIIVFQTDRIGGRFHVGRIGGPKSEQIRHAQTAVAPGFGERNAAADGWVIAHLIRRAGIEADEHRVARRGWVAEVTPQGVTVSATGREQGRAFGSNSHQVSPTDRSCLLNVQTIWSFYLYGSYPK